MSTWEVLARAVELGANFVITHEPTFYNHHDETGWLAEDKLYQAKRKLIEAGGLTIWRYHDGWHMHRPDGILAGVERQLGWQGKADPETPYLFHLDPLPLGSLAADLKSKTGAEWARVAGPLEMVAHKVAILAGAGPGEWHLEAFSRYSADVVVCGEAPEWQVPEYVRDANAAGIPKGLILLGHERSEEAGMGLLAEQLRSMFPAVPVWHVPSGDPLRVV
jgi:putative NIF3 family GTP cyclohydrolase 1 type 2